MMIPLLSIILIHSAPLDELAQGPPPPPVLKADQTITVKSFQFSGNKLVPTKRLERITSPYLSRSISERELSEIEHRLELLYKTLGYKDAKVTVVSASEQGVVSIKIIEEPTGAAGSK